MANEFRTLAPYVRRALPQYLAGLFFLVLTDGAQLYVPQLIRRAIDLLASGSFELAAVAGISALMVAVAVLVAIGRFFWRHFIQGASRRIEAELREKLFVHLQSLSSTFYARKKTGDLMAHMTNDMNAIRMAMGMAVVAFVDGVFMSVAILAILFATHPRLALVSISPLTILSVGVVLFGRAVGARFKRVQEGFSAMSDFVQESITGVRVVKTFVQEDAFVARFAERNDEYARRNLSLIRIFGSFFPAVSLLAGATSLLFLLFGGRAVIESALSPGEFTAFFAYLGMLVWPMMGAGFTINHIQRAGASLGRINRILEEKPDITSPPTAARVRPRDVVGQVSIRGLTYAYPGSDRPVLEGIDIEIPAGTILGIAGRTAAGKTTLVNLLPRILDPPEGTVFVDGRDVHDWNLRDLRRAIAVVPQDGFLFSTSVKENIRFGLDTDTEQDRDEEELLRRVTAISTIDRDLSVLPSGWDTVIGERGVTLSGGQKQRVALARALARAAAITILDDSLASVDTETESAILQELLRHLAGRTLILISHRVATLRVAHQVVVLEGGRISQRGTHEELVRGRGFYADIARLQQLEQALEPRP